MDIPLSLQMQSIYMSKKKLPWSSAKLLTDADLASMFIQQERPETQVAFKIQRMNAIQLNTHSLLARCTSTKDEDENGEEEGEQKQRVNVNGSFKRKRMKQETLLTKMAGGVGKVFSLLGFASDKKRSFVKPKRMYQHPLYVPKITDHLLPHLRHNPFHVAKAENEQDTLYQLKNTMVGAMSNRTSQEVEEDHFNELVEQEQKKQHVLKLSQSYNSYIAEDASGKENSLFHVRNTPEGPQYLARMPTTLNVCPEIKELVVKITLACHILIGSQTPIDLQPPSCYKFVNSDTDYLIEIRGFSVLRPRHFELFYAAFPAQIDNIWIDYSTIGDEDHEVDGVLCFHCVSGDHDRPFIWVSQGPMSIPMALLQSSQPMVPLSSPLV
jgi:hypothetical protein